MQTQEVPVFENTGLTELEKAWKKYSHTDTDTLIRITEENFENGEYAVALFLADKILKEKNTGEETRIRLSFVRAECYYEFKFFRQAYHDYKYYTQHRGSNETLDKKIRWCRRMIHTGNNGSLLFIAVFWLASVIMYLFLYEVQQNVKVNGQQAFPMGLDIDYVYYAGYIGVAMLLFGLFYRYVVIARMK